MYGVRTKVPLNMLNVCFDFLALVKGILFFNKKEGQKKDFKKISEMHLQKLYYPFARSLHLGPRVYFFPKIKNSRYHSSILR